MRRVLTSTPEVELLEYHFYRRQYGTLRACICSDGSFVLEKCLWEYSREVQAHRDARSEHGSNHSHVPVLCGDRLSPVVVLEHRKNCSISLVQKTSCLSMEDILEMGITG